MDTEQLKLIIEAISGLGADAKEAFIVYMVAWAGVHMAMPIITGASVLGAIWMVCRLSRHFIYQMCASSRLRGSAGMAPNYEGAWRADDLERVCAFLREHKGSL